MSAWECSGFERNEKGETWIIWECQNCGQEVAAGLQPPDVPCPYCGAGKKEEP